MTEGAEEIKSFLKVKEQSEKAGLKLNIQKTKIMASSPNTSWQIDGETMETVTDYFLGLQKSLQMVTAAMKLKTLAPWEESYPLLTLTLILTFSPCLRHLFSNFFQDCL